MLFLVLASLCLAVFGHGGHHHHVHATPHHNMCVKHGHSYAASLHRGQTIKICGRHQGIKFLLKNAAKKLELGIGMAGNRFYAYHMNKMGKLAGKLSPKHCKAPAHGRLCLGITPRHYGFQITILKHRHQKLCAFRYMKAHPKSIKSVTSVFTHANKKRCRKFLIQYCNRVMHKRAMCANVGHHHGHHHHLKTVRVGSVGACLGLCDLYNKKCHAVHVQKKRVKGFVCHLHGVCHVKKASARNWVFATKCHSPPSVKKAALLSIMRALFG